MLNISFNSLLWFWQDEKNAKTRKVLVLLYMECVMRDIDGYHEPITSIMSHHHSREFKVCHNSSEFGFACNFLIDRLKTFVRSLNLVVHMLDGN